MAKILFIYKHNRSFVDRDFTILSKRHEVTAFKFSFKHMFRLYRELKKCDIVYVWFASYHAYITSKLTNKPIVVAVGGYDASDIKSYGMFSSYFRKKIVRSIYKRATKIFPVDNSLANALATYAPETIPKTMTIPTGYDFHYFKPKGEKENIVITVCFVDKTNLWRKGLNTLIDVAREISDVPFYIIGKVADNVRNSIKNLPENVILTDWVSDEELLKMYQKAKVFTLLSKHEGLPNVLCEAMLCNCIPVTTGVCGIPNAQGTIGYYVGYGKKDDIIVAIKKALQQETTNEGRDRIKELFNVEKRERELNKLIGEVK